MGGCFVLESLRLEFIPDSIQMRLINFGSPTSVALEVPYHQLHKRSRKILAKYHNMTHIVCNQFDLFPRRHEWWFGVMPYAIKKISSRKIANALYLPQFVEAFVARGVTKGIYVFIPTLELSNNNIQFTL